MASGPLTGVKIVEFAGIGPGPFCCMLLGDMGADIVRIDRRGTPDSTAHVIPREFDVASRGRRSVVLDLKDLAGKAVALQLVDKADAIVEGFRPGVMERLGFGPDVLLARNPRLVYGRITGWGQHGPLAHAAGHDINYIAITGALAAIGPKEQPLPPMNLLGDYAGGSMYLAMGVLAGIIQARATGQGQVVDAAISDGVSSLMSVAYGLLASGWWKLGRNNNNLDGGAPNYGTFECADGKWISIAATGKPFYKQLRDIAGFTDPEFDQQRDRAHWSSLKAKIAAKFKTKTRAEWCALMEGTDVCFAPVLDMTEAPQHAHNKAREVFVTQDGVVQPAPAPRFLKTPGKIQGPAPEIGQHTESALADWGIAAAEIAKVR